MAWSFCSSGAINFGHTSTMSYKQKLEHSARISRHIDRRKALAWFVGIFFPITLVLSAFITWHNHLVGTPTVFHVLIRAAIAFAAFGVGMIVFFLKVIRAAVLAAAAEEEDEDAAY